MYTNCIVKTVRLVYYNFVNYYNIALPDMYLEKLLSVCIAGVYISICIAKHITGAWLSCCIKFFSH